MRVGPSQTGSVYIDGLQVYNDDNFTLGMTHDNFRVKYAGVATGEVTQLDPLDGISHACRIWNQDLWSASGSSYTYKRINDFRGALPTTGGFAADSIVEFSGILVTGTSPVAPIDLFDRHKIFATTDITTAALGFTFASRLEPIDGDSWRRIGGCDGGFNSPKVEAANIQETYADKIMMFKLPANLIAESVNLSLAIDAAAPDEMNIVIHDGIAQLRLPGFANPAKDTNVGALRPEHGMMMFHPSMEQGLWETSSVQLKAGFKDTYSQLWIDQIVPFQMTSTNHCSFNELDQADFGNGGTSGFWTMLSGTQPPFRVQIPVERY